MMARRSTILAALLLASVACGRQTAEEVESETVVPVSTEPAVLGSIRAFVNATGSVTAAPGADLLVVAPAPARIAEMPKAEGDRVRAGDVLVRFEIPSLNADMASRRAELTRAEARLANARAAQMRAHELFDTGVAARKEVEDADRELAEAEAGVTEAQATLAAAQTAAARTTVRATFDGVIAKRTHNPGDLVDAAASDPVLRIVDPQRLEVSAAIPVTDVARIQVGAAGHLASAAGGPDIPLRVVSRPAAVDPQTATAPVRLRFARPTALPVATPVQVSVEAEEHTNVVLVPSVAIIHEADESAVFVAHGDKAERRVVTVGIDDGTHAEVTAGVKAGEPVIVKGQAGLPDGAMITIAKTEPEP